MIAILQALQDSGPAAFLRTSFWLYPIVNALHVLAIGALVTSAILMDLRVLGAGRAIPLDAAVRVPRPVAVVALAAALLTGFTLFSVQPIAYAENPAFPTKMGLLLLAIGNALLFTTFRAHRQDGVMPKILAVASAALWISTAFAGRFIGYLI